jgi:D-arabinose 1-dehydrogenase-like Zn-dependent alcohol dehydrogenase
MTSRAIVQDGYDKENPLSTLKIVTRPIPRAGPNQVVVRVTARPINPTDFISVRNGLVGGNGTGTIGSEGCGFVHEVSMHEFCNCIPGFYHMNLLLVTDSRVPKHLTFKCVKF